MKPWQTMLLFTLLMSVVVAVLGNLFPALHAVFVVLGAVVIVLVGRKVLQGDSNEKEI